MIERPWRAAAAVGAACTIVGGFVTWQQRSTTAALVAVSGAGLAVAGLAGWIWSLELETEKGVLEHPRLKLQLLQALGIFATAFGLLLSYGTDELTRFSSTKPLFSLRKVSLSGSRLTFDIRNDGGWLMFLGVTTGHYARESNWHKVDEELPECWSAVFTKTPRRYQVVASKYEETETQSAKTGGAHFEVDSSQLPADGSLCPLHLGWVDGSEVQYDQYVKLRNAPPYVTLVPPRFKRPKSLPLATIAAAIALVDDEAPELPKRAEEGDADKDLDRLLYCVATSDEPGCVPEAVQHVEDGPVDPCPCQARPDSPE